MTANRSACLPGTRLTIRRLALSVTLLLSVTLPLAGCGSSKPSKPAYCSDRANLESSVKELGNFDVSSGLSGLQQQLGKIHTTATSLINSAKGDFPSETGAMQSSLQSLTATVKGLPADPSRSQIGTVAKQSSAFVNSVKSFTKATSSKCG